MNTSYSADTESSTLRAGGTTVRRLRCVCVAAEQIAGMYHHSAGETLKDFFLLRSVVRLRAEGGG